MIAIVPVTASPNAEASAGDRNARTRRQAPDQQRPVHPRHVDLAHGSRPTCGPHATGAGSRAAPPDVAIENAPVIRPGRRRSSPPWRGRIEREPRPIQAPSRKNGCGAGCPVAEDQQPPDRGSSKEAGSARITTDRMGCRPKCPMSAYSASAPVTPARGRRGENARGSPAPRGSSRWADRVRERAGISRSGRPRAHGDGDEPGDHDRPEQLRPPPSRTAGGE